MNLGEGKKEGRRINVRRMKSRWMKGRRIEVPTSKYERMGPKERRMKGRLIQGRGKHELGSKYERVEDEWTKVKLKGT